ncbi:MAG TPA: saccharopine dehydrogenase NADP-binding domain-containing protein [Stenotrophomonas sp.]|nr:saccharopine dehydrogenase NADP-binding domain-containing protein [Stenotrophomonas sp.]
MQEAPKACRILVLGGYGHFGARIVRALAAGDNVEVVVAGRSATLQGPAIFADLPRPARLHYTDLDSTSPALDTELSCWRPALVIHTAGPFQGQGYEVAQACLRAGAHYVDLADGRDFVREFPARIDAAARAAGLAAITGASTLPAISSAVVDALRDRFDRLHEIDIVIAPAQRTPLGLATVRAVLSYCGAPFQCWRDGRWQETVGWRGPRWVSFPHLRPRLASPCDVPDHDLLMERYPGVRSVRFRAALELPLLSRALAMIAALRRWGVPVPMAALAPWFARAARHLDRFGSELGGMSIEVRGECGQQRRAVRWDLTAPALHGPEIPCLAAVLLARRLANGQALPVGAQACMGILTLADFEGAFAQWAIETEVGGTRPVAA